MDKLSEFLVNSGPAGIIAAVLLYLLMLEKKDHKETRQAFNETVDRLEALVEKTVEAMTTVTTLIKERLPR